MMSDFEVCPVGTLQRLAAAEAERDALRAALDAALEFAGVVAGGASWWDDVWPEHEAAIAKAQGGGNG